MNAYITRDEISKGIVSIVSEALRADKNKIKTDSRLFKDLDAESLDLLDIRFSLEKEFDIKIGEDEIKKSIENSDVAEIFMDKLTIGRLTEFVCNKLNQN